MKIPWVVDQMAQQVKSTNAKIEALNADHYAKEEKAYMDFQNDFKSITAQIMALKLVGLGPGLGQEVQEFQRLEDAARDLGVTLESSLHTATV